MPIRGGGAMRKVRADDDIRLISDLWRVPPVTTRPVASTPSGSSPTVSKSRAYGPWHSDCSETRRTAPMFSDATHCI